MNSSKLSPGIVLSRESLAYGFDAKLNALSQFGTTESQATRNSVMASNTHGHIFYCFH